MSTVSHSPRPMSPAATAPAGNGGAAVTAVSDELDATGTDTAPTAGAGPTAATRVAVPVARITRHVTPRRNPGPTVPGVPWERCVLGRYPTAQVAPEGRIHPVSGTRTPHEEPGQLPHPARALGCWGVPTAAGLSARHTNRPSV